MQINESNPRRSASGGWLSRLFQARLVTHLIVVAALASLLHGMVFAVSMIDPAARQMEEDSHGFVTLSENMAAGKGFARYIQMTPDSEETWMPELCRTPGYPGVLAAMGALSEHNREAVVLLQHVLYVGLCLLGTVLCRRMCGPACGLAAGLLLALDLHAAALANLVMSETIFAVLLLLAALATARTWSTLSLKWAICAGLTLSLATIIKPSSIGLPVVVAVILILRSLRRRQWRPVLAGVVMAIAGNCITVGWIVRNGMVAGEYVFTCIPRYQLAFEHSAWAVAEKHDRPIESVRTAIAAEAGLTRAEVRSSPLSEEQESRLRSVALNKIWQARGAFVRAFAVRSVGMLCGPDKNILLAFGLPRTSFHIIGGGASVSPNPVLMWTLLIPQCLHVGVVWVLVARTLYLLLRRRGLHVLAWTCLLFAAYLLVLSLGVPGDPRYRWPAMPLLVIAGIVSFRKVPNVDPAPAT